MAARRRRGFGLGGAMRASRVIFYIHEQEHGMAVSKVTGKSLNMGGHKVKSGNAKT